ncbi:hypothetical protein D3C87_731250 [compost metagenome]
MLFSILQQLASLRHIGHGRHLDAGTRIEAAQGRALAYFQFRPVRQRAQAHLAVGRAVRRPVMFDGAQGVLQTTEAGARGGHVFADVGAAEEARAHGFLDAAQLFLDGRAAPRIGAGQTRVQGFQVGQQMAVVVVVGRLPGPALGVRKAVAVVAIRLVGAPGVRRGELQVCRFARQAHGVAEIFAAQHGVIKAVRKDAGGLVVDAPAGRDHGLRAHFNEGRGQAGGQFRPWRDGVRAHVAQVAAIDEDELRHALQFAHLRRRQPRLRSQHQARMGDAGAGHFAMAGQVDGEIALVEQVHEHALGLRAQQLAHLVAVRAEHVRHVLRLGLRGGQFGQAGIGVADHQHAVAGRADGGRLFAQAGQLAHHADARRQRAFLAARLVAHQFPRIDGGALVDGQDQAAHFGNGRLQAIGQHQFVQGARQARLVGGVVGGIHDQAIDGLPLVRLLVDAVVGAVRQHGEAQGAGEVGGDDLHAAPAIVAAQAGQDAPVAARAVTDAPLEREAALVARFGHDLLDGHGGGDGARLGLFIDGDVADAARHARLFQAPVGAARAVDQGPRAQGDAQAAVAGTG